MKFNKLAAALLCFSIIVTTSVFAQSRSETTVEDEYLSSIEDAIITELASSPDYENKLIALEYLEEAISNGRASKEMVQALSGLAGEGVTTQSRTNGRLMNNYPDIRAKACDLLGEIPTEEAKNTLVDIAKEDVEPMVTAAAIRSLGNIGINNGDEVVAMIEFVEHKYAALNPTSSLALEIIIAYEKLAPTVQDRSAMIQSISEIATNYHYASTVRTRALKLLKTLQTGSSGK